MRLHPLVFLTFWLLITFLTGGRVNSQILFAEDCFKGGITATGAGNVGSGMGIQADVRWEPGFDIRAVYAVTHRFGWIAPHTMFVNGGPVHWDGSSQVGPETPLDNPGSHPFAVHVRDVTESVVIEDSVVVIDFPPQQGYANAWNWGWWSIYLVILYEAPHIDQEVCFRLYTADQSQSMIQNYKFPTPSFLEGSPLLLSLFAARLNNFDEDKSRVWINGEVLGDIKGFDPTVPPTIGTQGHFYYEQSQAEGLNGDTANAQFLHHDAVALLNNHLVSEPQQSLSVVRIQSSAGNSGNLHPAFTLAYTPSCPVVSSGGMPRRYALCRGDTVVLEGIEGFDHYAWSPDLQLSDSMAMSPTCIPDSSRWYRLRMWNEDEADGCPLTIPVYVEVGQTPRPDGLTVVHSSCPASTGAIRLEDLQGLPPYQLQAGSQSQENPPFQNFTNLPPGTYPLSVVDDFGCSWDSTVVINLNTPHTAAFAATPTEGVSPLGVIFGNQSTGANGYQWLIDGAPFSTATNAGFTFPDSGSFEVSLVAYFDSPSCADTATVLIRVEPGIRVIMPNIFTPNGDGRNDELVAKVLGARSLRWEVFNRWGSHLHSGSTNPDPLTESDVVMWSPPQAPAHHGSSRPEGAMAEGTYVLVLTAEGITGKVDKMEFVVSLRR